MTARADFETTRSTNGRVIPAGASRALTGQRDQAEILREAFQLDRELNGKGKSGPKDESAA